MPDYCCDTPLSFPGFSVVFLHTFSIHHLRKFTFPQLKAEASEEGRPLQIGESDLYKERADYLEVPIARVKRDIEHQIFILHSDKDEDIRNVRRFSLRGFDFEMPVGDGGNEIILKGHCNVEMSLFFGHAVSITYRFLFDGNACTLSRDAKTDDIIALLSIWLGAEHWSAETFTGASITDINLESRFLVSDLHFAEDGSYLDEGTSLDMHGKGRYFGAIAFRYKSFIYRFCTRFQDGISRKLRNAYRFPTTVENDLHYAMVDIWSNLRHISEDGIDLFGVDNPASLSEPEIINHLRDSHKQEIMGLLTLYPGEWPYRDSADFDEVCGSSIAIDTDDLVLCGSSICVVFGTYGRRGEEAQGIDWVEHLKERAKYHVSWPEYLVILQMVLARKYIIANVTDRLIESTDSMTGKSLERIIRENAELQLRLTRMILRLDVVKMSKFPAHKVMYDRTCRRLGLNEDMANLQSLMDTLDNSLSSLSDSKSARSESIMNLVLGFISIASAFQLFFMDTRMPFLDQLGIQDRPVISVVTIAAVAALAIFAILYLISHAILEIFGGASKKKR